MRTINLISVTMAILLLALIVPIYASDKAVEVRSQVYNLGQNETSFDNTTFPGFYYDIDNNIGAEKLTLRLSKYRSC